MQNIENYGAGFYFIDDFANLIYAPTAVYAPNFNLHRDSRDQFTYPFHGWYWFDSYEQAVAHWNIEVPPSEEEIREEKLAELERLKQELGL